MSTGGDRPIRVIGVGSPFGADRAGWLAVEYLRGGLADGALPLRLEIADRPGMQLVGLLAGAEVVVIIDALRGGQPGEVRIVDLDELAGTSESHSSHGFGVAEALCMAAVLGQLPPELYLIGIATGTGDDVPDAAFPAVAELLHGVLGDYRIPIGNSGEIL